MSHRAHSGYLSNFTMFDSQTKFHFFSPDPMIFQPYSISQYSFLCNLFYQNPEAIPVQFLFSSPLVYFPSPQARSKQKRSLKGENSQLKKLREDLFHLSLTREYEIAKTILYALTQRRG